MVSDRQSAKKAVVARDKDDPELDATLSAAHAYQLSITREANRHKEEMRGWFAKVFGPRDSAVTFIAFLAMVFGVLLTIGCLFAAAYAVTSNVAFWGQWAERAIAFSTSALAFIFGKGIKKSK
jgi:hypothetical protein